MKIIQDQRLCDLSSLRMQAARLLREQAVVVLDTDNYLEHIATYLAWLDHGGTVFVKAPGLPAQQDQHVMSCLQSRLPVKDAVIFHTSGTTGYPKLVINHARQLEQACEMSTHALEWNQTTNFLTFVPPYTTGFWHIILPATVAHGSTLTLGNKQTVVTDLAQSDCNTTILVPGLINRLRSVQAQVDLSHFATVGVGASQVNQQHVDYVFDHGAASLAHLYGASETASPLLSRTTRIRDHSEWLNTRVHGSNQIKLVNNELWVQGQSVCSNLEDFAHDGDWIGTGDLWEQQDNLIRFVGRNNDIVKLNGFRTNLLLIERMIEERTPIGECLAVPRHTAGTDWIELLYTDHSVTIDRDKLSNILEPVLSRCSIPKKYTRVDHIPKNALGKKTRHV